MFVKQAYERRLKKQDQQLNKFIANKKIRQPQIGSIKNDKVNYDKEQQFFSKDDIPLNARTIKQQINKLIDPDHLGLRKKDWNASVSVPKSFEKEQTHQQKLLKIKLGFTDNPIPKYTAPVIYQGTQTRNDYTNWNVSNQIIRKEVRANLFKTTQMAAQNTKLKEDKLLKTYANPLSKTTIFIQAGKMKVQSEAQLRQRLRQYYIFENPTASQQRINAAVHRLAYETQVKEKKDDIAAEAMKTDFKANLSLTQKNKIHAEYYHTGIWQKFTINGQQNWSWSCCQNQDHDSKGCVLKMVDKNKWNLSSFNNQ